MIPHERSLVEKWGHRPFALVGVNTDGDQAKLRAKLAEHQVTWRSFWNGPQGTAGPISTAWGVSGYPTLFLIDHDGIIRRKSLGDGGDEFWAEAEKLIAAAEAAAKR